MPSDPIVNDHYGDFAVEEWQKTSSKILLTYVLNLNNIEKDFKDKLNKKLIFGL